MSNSGKVPKFLIRSAGRGMPGVCVGDGLPKLIAVVGLTGNAQAADDELAKAKLAGKLGVRLLADVTTVGDIAAFQRRLTAEIDMPLCSVPLYEIHQEAKRRRLWNDNLPRNLVLDVIEAQAERGVGCMTIHASYRREHLKKVEHCRRRVRIQGRGAGLVHDLFVHSQRENPLAEGFEEILGVLRRHGVALSLGNCLRVGSAEDPVDELVHEEVLIWRELASLARQRGVGVMIEGGSHLRMEMIGPYIRWVSELCAGAPLRMLGPIATEAGLGYDHITGAISAVEAIRGGAELLTVVTRAEHIGLPSVEDVREGIVAYRIAIELTTSSEARTSSRGHFSCGLGLPGYSPGDFIDLERALELRVSRSGGAPTTCSMCGELCGIKLGRASVERSDA